MRQVERLALDDHIPRSHEVRECQFDLAPRLLFELRNKLLKPVVSATHDGNRELFLSVNAGQADKYRGSEPRLRKANVS